MGRGLVDYYLKSGKSSSPGCKSGCIGWMIFNQSVLFIIHTTSAQNASSVNVPMSVKRSLSVTPTVLLVSSAIRSASTLSKNSVTGLIKRLMSAMDVPKPKADAQFRINISMMRNSLSASMRSSEQNQEKV